MGHLKDLATIADIIEDAKAGRMFILVDDEDRENEGDLVIPAEKADAEAINFMAKHGRGLICLSMTEARVRQLNLPLMSRHNASRHQTAFAVSIEAREGVTTGISAADRAQTVKVAIDPTKGASDIASPGHVFPLVARDGGVLVRAGHTEAAVDIARLAGLNPSGVICEIMNDDGTMARLPDLLKFADAHGLKIATIADLIAYRRRAEKLVEQVLAMPFASKAGGEFTLMLYRDVLSGAEHVVLQKGRIDSEKPTLVRMHASDFLTDILQDATNPKAGDLHRAMHILEQQGSGLVVILRNPLPGVLSEQLLARQRGEATAMDLRAYGIGAQILLDLGVHDMILITSSPRPVVGLEGYGLNIVGHRTFEDR